MLIDWFTVVAQLINFLILVWLMKRFLYQPILDAIDAREKRIAAKLADATAKCAEAEQARAAFQHKITEFELQRAALLSEAKEAAETRRTQLLTDAQQTADTLGQQRRDALIQEYQKLKSELARLTQEEVFAIARKVLVELSGDTLETRMSEVFVQRLKDLDSTTRDELISALSSGSDPVRVLSVFVLPPPQRQAIQATLQDLFSTEVPVQFDTTPTLINGLELTVNGLKLDWNIADYLTAMETRVSALFAVSAAGQNPTHQSPGADSTSPEAPA